MKFADFSWAKYNRERKKDLPFVVCYTISALFDCRVDLFHIWIQWHYVFDKWIFNFISRSFHNFIHLMSTHTHKILDRIIKSSIRLNDVQLFVLIRKDRCGLSFPPERFSLHTIVARTTFFCLLLWMKLCNTDALLGTCSSYTFCDCSNSFTTPVERSMWNENWMDGKERKKKT